MPIFLILSYSVREGTLYLRDACKAVMPDLTASMAFIKSSLEYCLYLFHSCLLLPPLDEYVDPLYDPLPPGV